MIFYYNNCIMAGHSLSKTLGVSSRSIEKDIELLKNQGSIQFEGSRKTGKYKPTEKYKKLKEKYKLKSNALKVRNKVRNKNSERIFEKPQFYCI